MDTNKATAATLSATMSATDLYFLTLTLEELARKATYPALTVTVRDLADADDDGTGHPFEFTCPHCNQISDSIQAHDVSHRETESNEVTREGKVPFSYQRGSDFHSLVYLTSCCDRPVNLPEGWVES